MADEASAIIVPLNVHGHTLRCRTADDVEQLIRRHAAQGARHFFITDDNFARNPGWEPIVDRLIHLREREGLRLALIVQADTRAYKIPGFIGKLARAGCRIAFIGLESLNRADLDTINKRQNVPSEYRAMLQEWRRHGVLIFAGFIIGFPEDTYDSVMRDVDYLKQELPLDLAEFFILTPHPGSEDHRNHVLRKGALEPNLNFFDGMHACADHPRMPRHELERAQRDAWLAFYSRAHMKTLLLRRKDRRRKELARKLTWTQISIRTEKLHPMMSGILRIKGRRNRSPNHPLESLPAYYWRRFKDLTRAVPMMIWWAAYLHYLHWQTGKPGWQGYRDKAIDPEPGTDAPVKSHAGSARD